MAGANKWSPGCNCCTPAGCSVTVTGTAASNVCSTAPGATIVIKDHSDSSVLGTTTAASNGTWSATVTTVSNPPVVDLVISCARYTTLTVSGVSCTCDATTATGSHTLTALTDYVSPCCFTSAMPLNKTLFLTDANGTWTMTWQGIVWTACYTVTNPTVFDGSCNIASGTTTVGYRFNGTSISYSGAGLVNTLDDPSAWAYYPASCNSDGSTNATVPACTRTPPFFPGLTAVSHTCPNCAGTPFSSTWALNVTNITSKVATPAVAGGTVTLSE